MAFLWPACPRRLAAVHAAAGPSAAGDGERFLVYFDEFSANITPQAQAVIADAVGQGQGDLSARAIRIEARASATGSPAANQKLTETRAQVVADELQKDGLEPGHVPPGADRPDRAPAIPASPTAGSTIGRSSA